MVEVNRVKVRDTFVPISIILETKEEADGMYAVLNCAPGLDCSLSTIVDEIFTAYRDFRERENY